MENENDKDTLAPVANIADARKPIGDLEESPLEAYGPMSVRIIDNDWHITACDGEQVYMWTATQIEEGGTYEVIEVYPALTMQSTELRDATEPADLVLFKDDDALHSLADVVEAIEEVLYEGFEEEAEVN